MTRKIIENPSGAYAPPANPEIEQSTSESILVRPEALDQN